MINFDNLPLHKAMYLQVGEFWAVNFWMKSSLHYDRMSQVYFKNKEDADTFGDSLSKMPNIVNPHLVIFDKIWYDKND